MIAPLQTSVLVVSIVSLFDWSISGTEVLKFQLAVFLFMLLRRILANSTMNEVSKQHYDNHCRLRTAFKVKRLK